MSSNIQIQRICQYCNTEFTARTTVTKYCSHKCSQRAYKLNKRVEKIEKANKESKETLNRPISSLKDKEYLSIDEVSAITGISRRTLYRLIASGELGKIKIGSRTLIGRSDINNFFADKKIEPDPLQNKESTQSFTWSLEDCYNIGEIQTKFGISEKALYETIKRNAIPKKKSGWYTYVPKELIEPILKQTK